MTFLKSTLALVLAAVMLPSVARAVEPITVYKSASCGCCIGWIKYLEANGFQVIGKDLPAGALMQKKLATGLQSGQTSCHTGQVAGYTVEGHVPAREIRRLLSERPNEIGLTVPDMPLGSPGMEAGDDKDPYDVFLVAQDGSTEVFARY